MSGEACRYKRQTQFIVNKAHVVEQALHAGGVAVNKQQVEKVGKPVMDSAG